MKGEKIYLKKVPIEVIHICLCRYRGIFMWPYIWVLDETENKKGDHSNLLVKKIKSL
jgi:hypothetical protein